MIHFKLQTISIIKSFFHRQNIPLARCGSSPISPIQGCPSPVRPLCSGQQSQIGTDAHSNEVHRVAHTARTCAIGAMVSHTSWKQAQTWYVVNCEKC